MTEKEKLMNDFKESLEKKTAEELQALEKEIITEAEALDKEAAEKTFILMENDKNEIKPATRKKMGQLISNYIARNEMSWQQALLVKLIVDFWQSSSIEVKFPVLDNTLRLLGQVKYSGIDDVENIIYINNLFENIRAEFMNFSEKLYNVAEKHQILLNEMQIRTAAPVEK